jgi:hypothetical protein
MIEKSFSRGKLKNGKEIDYGFGWHRKNFLMSSGKTMDVVYHTGSTRGFRNVIYKIPSENFTIIILTNRNENEPLLLAEHLAELFFKLNNFD